MVLGLERGNREKWEERERERVGKSGGSRKKEKSELI